MHLQYRHDDAPLLPSTTGGFTITRLLPRASTDTCHPQPNMNLCEKSAISSSSLFIALVIARRTKLEKKEDLKDPQELDDYGIAPQPRRPTSQMSGMPKVPPPVVQTRERNPTGDDKMQSPVLDGRRASQESLTPSLRQAMGIAPRDPFANR
ncbi:hypothetical protein B0T10DRAFT_456191 [Thelonectria olida]|uniref:Uncharacterized protein n=1 Tax=Thelonectria olida TaxID=1576542 RepID=A0A9P9AU63_9HYPO|nr:hypothetical protein B0T10DRAFT_456191 [Thelonectria olida]